jgi:type II secretory pathway pseudopilin PulG
VRGRTAGFTLIELLIAMTMTLAITAAALTLAQPAQTALRVQLEAVDVTQRLRAAADALSRDMLMAGSGLPPGVPGLTPYQPGTPESGLTVWYVPAPGDPVAMRSYYVRVDPDANLYELRRTDAETDVPVVDHIANVVFSCFDDVAVAVPSCGDAARIRRIRIAVRVQAVMRHTRITHAMLRVPDEEIIVDVAPRSLHAGG